jgi:(p)ppGpp synthase/HD superfamily hydrolase
MNPREQLKDWVQLKHRGQLIKKTDEPYFNHLLRVAGMAGETPTPFAYEIGLCHDLLEDTETKVVELQTAMQGFGYLQSDTAYIVACVVELTDVYTKKAYPQLKKAKRKEKEANRLIKISPAAQTVKYADLIDNIAWILKYDRKKAVAYLDKKNLLLLRMDKGNDGLRKKAFGVINHALRNLEFI